MSEYAVLQKTVERLDDVGFDLNLRQIIRSERACELEVDAEPRTAMVDLSILTDRQRYIAETAVAMGYFTNDGVDAEMIAAKLNISQSTLSQHLRIVIQKILSQLFP